MPQDADDNITGMARKILSVGYEIPGFSEDSCEYMGEQSLLDADVIIFQPDVIDSDDGGKPSYTETWSYRLQQSARHWGKELDTALEYGKTVFLFLVRHQVGSIYTGRSEIKGRTRINYVADYSNYDFLPINLPSMTSKKGSGVVFSGDPAFAIFWREFGTDLRYECYFDEKVKRPVFVTRTGERPIGAVFSVKKGHLVTLPMIHYEEKKFVKTRRDGDEYWTEAGLSFGRKLVSVLIDIDQSLRSASAETPSPTWAKSEEFNSAEELRILGAIEDAVRKMEELRGKQDSLQADLRKEQEVKNLLFEKGKPLEAAVISALRALGYTAENYDDGELELDQIIVSPEGERLIGECEGKDNSAINIEKLRQLSENVQADLQKEEVAKPATAILFGNGFRLSEPKDRPAQFTEKCLSSAKRATILVRTMDLYPVVRYIRETNDQNYMKACRDAITASVGTIVTFPVPPNH